MSESEDRMLEILRILNEQEKPTGSKFIADELKNKGFNLGERAVRYHMKMLDEKGYTERIGYSGRQITELGRATLEKGIVYDQVDFIYSKFEEMIYLTDFTYINQSGNVVVNTSTIYNEESLNIIKSIFESGLSVSPYSKINKDGNEGTEIKTICGTTIDGILLKEGIITIPKYGGLVKIEDYSPVEFSEIISYRKTSISPLDAFIAPKTTSVLDVIDNGCGIIPANFRLIPKAGYEKAMKIINDLSKIGINGVIGVNDENNLLGIPIPKNMVGITIIGGVTPFCGLQELGYEVDIKIAEEIENFKNLKPITNIKPILKENTHSRTNLVSFLLSKSWNLIQKVNFDIETRKGDIIANVSYIKKDNLDEALNIMKSSYDLNKKYINPYYKIVNHPHDSSKIGIATICSLSIDGILIKNRTMSNPKYGGLLELSETPAFLDLISYSGSTLDPHIIFLAKNKTSIMNDEPRKLLASLKELPYVSIEYSTELLDTLKKIGFSIYKIGKPREVVYNAKIDNYNFGVVAGSGLNSIAAIKEKGIDIEIKAIEKLMAFEEMDRL